MEPDLVGALETLGFSLNESRAYTALLQESPATGYEVGVRALVPRSAVYGVLRRLVKVGAARSIAGTPERFTPVPAEELLRLLRKRFDASCGQLEEAMRTVDAKPQAPDAFTVRGYGRVIEEAERLVRSAESRLLVSGWPRELTLLAPELKSRETPRLRRRLFPRRASAAARRGLLVRPARGGARDVLEAPTRRRRRRPPHAHRRHRPPRRRVVRQADRRSRRRERDRGHRRNHDEPGVARHHTARAAYRQERAGRHGEGHRRARRAARFAARIGSRGRGRAAPPRSRAPELNRRTLAGDAPPDSVEG